MTLIEALDTLKEYTLHVTLESKLNQPLGYTLYVFKNLETRVLSEKYITLIRFPNWEQAPFKINDEGYVHFRIAEAGKDKWYDSSKDEFVKYHYTNCIFLQFIPIKSELEDQIYTVD